MDELERANLQTVVSYLRALEAGATGEALSRFYSPDILQVEWPNRLNPQGGRSDLATLLRRAESVPQLLREQRFEIHSSLASGALVAIESTWTAVLAVPLGSLAAGDSMRAHFAIFFEMRDGRIHAQRNFDCFEPF